MALVVEGFEITLTAADQGDNRVTKTYVCDPSVVTDLTLAETARAALAAAWVNVSEAVIVGMTIKQIFFEDAITLPTGNVENENKASITSQILGKNKKANIKIPAPVIGLFNGATGAAANQVDVTDAALLVYLTQFTDTNPFLISDGEKLAQAQPLVGKRISAKNNNG